MTTISTISSKGGAGKTTSVISLAITLATMGASVGAIDADPNKFLVNWFRKLKGKPEALANLTVIGDPDIKGDEVDEDNIIERIQEAAAKYDFVLVDLEGTAAKIVVNAVAQSDFVVVPTQGSPLDAKEAAKAIRLIRQHELTMRRHVPDYKLPFSLLMTRTKEVARSRILTQIINDFEAAGVPVFKAELHERDAYKALFSFNTTFDGLDPKEVPGVDGARDNAKKYTSELIQTIRKGTRT